MVQMTAGDGWPLFVPTTCPVQVLVMSSTARFMFSKESSKSVPVTGAAGDKNSLIAQFSRHVSHSSKHSLAKRMCDRTSRQNVRCSQRVLLQQPWCSSVTPSETPVGLLLL
jgi:hypothetical protein